MSWFFGGDSSAPLPYPKNGRRDAATSRYPHAADFSIDCDYLVIGAGPAGLAFADELDAVSSSLTHPSVSSVVVIDSHPCPGGNWVNAYDFAKLTTPRENFGVNSVAFHEKATKDLLQQQQVAAFGGDGGGASPTSSGGGGPMQMNSSIGALNDLSSPSDMARGSSTRAAAAASGAASRYENRSVRANKKEILRYLHSVAKRLEKRGRTRFFFQATYKGPRCCPAGPKTGGSFGVEHLIEVVLNLPEGESDDDRKRPPSTSSSGTSSTTTASSTYTALLSVRARQRVVDATQDSFHPLTRQLTVCLHQHQGKNTHDRWNKRTNPKAARRSEDVFPPVPLPVNALEDSDPLWGLEPHRSDSLSVKEKTGWQRLAREMSSPGGARGGAAASELEVDLQHLILSDSTKSSSSSGQDDQENQNSTDALHEQSNMNMVKQKQVEDGDEGDDLVDEEEDADKYNAYAATEPLPDMLLECLHERSAPPSTVEGSINNFAGGRDPRDRHYFDEQAALDANLVDETTADESALYPAISVPREIAVQYHEDRDLPRHRDDRNILPAQHEDVPLRTIGDENGAGGWMKSPIATTSSSKENVFQAGRRRFAKETADYINLRSPSGLFRNPSSGTSSSSSPRSKSKYEDVELSPEPAAPSPQLHQSQNVLQMNKISSHLLQSNRVVFARTLGETMCSNQLPYGGRRVRASTLLRTACSHFVVIGGGQTGIDCVSDLILSQNVDPDQITWILLPFVRYQVEDFGEKTGGAGRDDAPGGGGNTIALLEMFAAKSTAEAKARKERQSAFGPCSGGAGGPRASSREQDVMLEPLISAVATKQEAAACRQVRRVLFGKVSHFVDVPSSHAARQNGGEEKGHANGRATTRRTPPSSSTTTSKTKTKGGSPATAVAAQHPVEIHFEDGTIHDLYHRGRVVVVDCSTACYDGVEHQSAGIGAQQESASALFRHHFGSPGGQAQAALTAPVDTSNSSPDGGRIMNAGAALGGSTATSSFSGEACVWLRFGFFLDAPRRGGSGGDHEEDGDEVADISASSSTAASSSNNNSARSTSLVPASVSCLNLRPVQDSVFLATFVAFLEAAGEQLGKRLPWESEAMGELLEAKGSMTEDLALDQDQWTKWKVRGAWSKREKAFLKHMRDELMGKKSSQSAAAAPGAGATARLVSRGKMVLLPELRGRDCARNLLLMPVVCRGTSCRSYVSSSVTVLPSRDVDGSNFYSLICAEMRTILAAMHFLREQEVEEPDEPQKRKSEKGRFGTRFVSWAHKRRLFPLRKEQLAVDVNAVAGIQTADLAGTSDLKNATASSSKSTSIAKNPDRMNGSVARGTATALEVISSFFSTHFGDAWGHLATELEVRADVEEATLYKYLQAIYKATKEQERMDRRHEDICRGGRAGVNRSDGGSARMTGVSNNNMNGPDAEVLVRDHRLSENVGPKERDIDKEDSVVDGEDVSFQLALSASDTEGGGAPASTTMSTSSHSQTLTGESTTHSEASLTYKGAAAPGAAGVKGKMKRVQQTISDDMGGVAFHYGPKTCLSVCSARGDLSLMHGSTARVEILTVTPAGSA